MFADLHDAGRQLAATLSEFYQQESTVVVGIAAGGVPVAAEVAKALKLPLEILLIRRLVATNPLQPGCAIDLADSLFIDEEIGPIPERPSSGFEHSLVDGLAELGRRKVACRGSLPVTFLEDKNVLLVDNGIRTGSTILAATRALKAARCRNITVAVPVANASIREQVEVRVDRLIVLRWIEKFGHVGLWYKNFSRPADDEIRKALEHVNREQI